MEGEGSSDKLPVADTTLALVESAGMQDKAGSSQPQQLPSSQPQQHFHSLPTPPTPELTAGVLQQQTLQNRDLQAQSVGAGPLAGGPAVYGAAQPETSKLQQPLYQWQASGSNFCVMGHPQFAPAPASAFPARRPPPLYYQATSEKTGHVASAVAAAAQSGPLRSPMSEFVVMKECIDGE